MNFIDFKKKMFDFALFNVQQIYAWESNFDRNNLTRWLKKGYIYHLKQGYYTFSEYLGRRDFAFYFANKIYNPSYISLHSALAFYGMIPEAIIQLTSVSSLKTSTFTNELGTFSYKTLKPELMFGYDLIDSGSNILVKIASPEKSILDLLYLYPFYNNLQDSRELRFDEDYINEKLNKDKIEDFLEIFKNKSLESRVKVFYKAYGL